MGERASIKTRIVEELVAANPKQRLKAVEFDSVATLRRVEWYDEDESGEQNQDTRDS